MWESLAQAICLILVIEGIAPFMDPKRWRSFVSAMTALPDTQLRMVGLASMVLGALVLCLI